MSAQKIPQPSSDSDAQPLNIIELLEKIKKVVNKCVPDGKLENRLLNLGLEEFIRDPSKDTEKTLRKYGFPFKFNGQLDEAILVLAHFLDRFKDEGGDLNIYLLNNVSNGESADLSYWQSAKAKLYLELQNLILQLDGFEWVEKSAEDNHEVTFKWNSRITRIFAFRNLVDIAYLNQSAISAMIEQLATGTQIGFLFSETFAFNRTGKKQGRDFPNTMLVEFKPIRKKGVHDVFLLQDQTPRNYLPYQERCKAKWFASLKKVEAKERKNLKGLLSIFNSENWGQFGQDSTKVCHFEDRGTEYFNKAAVMLYEAFRGSEISRGMRDDGEDPDKYIVNRINRDVISDDFMEIQRTMSIFDQAEDICAVDASSTKKSLKVHETSPTYRQWIRKSLNRALNPHYVLKTQGKSLNRIYILKDTHDERDIEFHALLDALQYYFDYYHYDISAMDTVVRVQPSCRERLPKEPPPWLENYWKSLRNRIHIYITTSSILKHVVDHFDKDLLAKLLSDVFAPTVVSSDRIHSYLIKLDYLFTRNLIYNYRNPRATPDEARDEAFLYRSAGAANLSQESNILFRFGDGLTEFTKLQTRSRMLSLLRVLEKYEERHESCDYFQDFLDSEAGKSLKTRVDEIRENLGSDNFLEGRAPQRLLDVRLTYESVLHRHYRKKFAFLHRLLEAFSVEVGFFASPKKESIHDVYPFEKAKSITMVNNCIKKAIKGRQDLIAGLNDELNSLMNHKEVDLKVEKPTVFISYASEDRDKVHQIYERLEQNGFNPWMDSEKLLPGQKWPLEIKRAIKRSSFFVACLSQNSVDKRGYVQRELKQALDNIQGMRNDDIYLIPVRLDDCEVPEELFEEFQKTDLFVDDQWNEDEWQRFLEALKVGLKAREPKKNGN